MRIKACVNGARGLSEHQRLSADPGDVADEARAAVAAGATAVHIHPKSPAGLDSLQVDHVDTFVLAVREACPDTPIGISTGAWAAPSVDDRVQAIRSWTRLPGLASVNWHEDGADDVAAALLDRGVGVEAGVWHAKGLAAWQSSPVRDSCLRVLIELGDCGSESAPQFVHRQALPLIEDALSLEPRTSILLHGEEGSTWAAIDLAARCGLDTRIGLEDTITLPDGSIAQGNAELVREALHRAATGALG